MRRLGGLLGLLLIAGACGGGDLSDDASVSTPDPVDTATTSSVTETTFADDPPPNLGPAKVLREIDGWLQTDIGSLNDLKGKVVVVHFWTFGCHNCKATLPNLEALYGEHQGEDFEIVGVHSPEFEYEKDPAAIADAAEDLGVTWPIALDTQRRSFFYWQGSPAYWPRTYVLDREGNVRFDHIGEGAYEELNRTVAVLLG